MNLETFKNRILPLQDLLQSYAKKVLANENDAEDAVQETLLKLWCIRNQLASHPHVEGYAMLTMKNICIDKIRQRKYTISIDDAEVKTTLSSSFDNIDNRNSVDIVRKIIERLPDLQRMIIQMRDVEGYEISEIAEITNSNISAVKVNLSRARKRVRDEFSKIQTK